MTAGDGVGAGAGPAPAVRGRAAGWAAGAALAGLLAAIYHRAAGTLWDTWTTNDTYSHGPLVPLVSLAMVWLARGRLRALPRRPDARGVLLVAAGCALHVVGVRADVFALQGWSLLPMLFGLALAFLGPAWARALAFPIAFLGFMLTFPPLVVNQLSFALKEVAVTLSAAAAEALGAVIRRQGMTLYLAGGELRIEHPCSGLRSLLALVATGTLLARITPGGAARRVALAALSVPAALLANAVRLAAVILVAHYGSVETAAGTFHDVSGYLVYALALGLLLLARRALMPWGPGPATAATAAAEAA